ncbi:MAG: hypothetical protein KME31_31085, partial [Tolypothrix carrinoi HA7290-LM1]|nr:hypothetical protein [Tolypothrix carrinoi HA7290-LM1]
MSHDKPYGYAFIRVDGISAIVKFQPIFSNNPSCGLSIDTACDHSIHAIAYNKVALVRSANVPMPLLPVF